MSPDTPNGPTRFAMTCTRCGESTAYPTQQMADEKLALHNAFVHTAGGCASRVHPARVDRRR
jgi:hypothetical protein